MTHANRGMALETLINHTNAVYLNKGMAVVHKRPTPVKILQTKGSRILSAVLEAPSTVDYEGVYCGRSLQFEAKSTKEKTNFPLSNIHGHQIEHIRKCMAAGAICFIILEFTKHNEVFYVPGKMVLDAWDASLRGGRKSIAYDDIATICYLVRSSRGVPVDYLQIVDKLIAVAT